MNEKLRKRLRRLFVKWCEELSTSEIIANQPLVRAIENLECKLFKKEELGKWEL